MNLQLITGHYMNDGNIRLYARGEDYKRRVIDVVGFEPYSGVLDQVHVPNDPRIVGVIDVPPGIYGEHLKGIVYSAPNVVPDFRELFPERWEDDVRFVRRAMIDIGLKGGFENPAGKMVHYTDLKPNSFTQPPLKCFWDIECYSTTRIPEPTHPNQPITCVTFWDDVNKHYYTLLLDDIKKKTVLAPDHTIFHCANEEDLLGLSMKYLERLQPDVLAEWGSLDRDYFPPRANFCNLDTSVFRTFCTFNMIPAYKKLYHKGSNRLKDVSFDEGIIDYIPPEVDFADLYDNHRMELVMKNKHDVEWIMKLNKLKDDLIDFFWINKNSAGLEDLQETTFHGVMVDTRLLRKYHGRYMLPSKPTTALDTRILIGGLLKKPPSALLDWVAVLDFSRYYPNIMIGVLKAMDQDWMKPIIELCEELLDERDYYDALLVKETPGTEAYNTVKGQRNSVKYIGEAVIGYFGWKKSRLYYPEIFEGVTVPGQQGMLYAEKVCKGLGHDMVYFDTDGGFVRVTPQKVDGLLEELNNAMAGWCEEHNIHRKLKLKLDRHADKALFTGAKKRYAMHIVREDNKDVDYVIIKGFEFVRRDSSLVTRDVQRNVFEHLLRTGMLGLKEYLSDITKKIRSGNYPLREIALSKGIRKEKFSDYKTKVDYIRGSLWANKHLNAGIIPGDQVYFVYVKRTPGYPSTDVVSFLDEDIIPKNFVIDWDRMIQRTIEGKVDNLIKEGGLSWAQVMGMKDLRSAF